MREAPAPGADRTPETRGGPRRPEACGGDTDDWLERSGLVREAQFAVHAYPEGCGVKAMRSRPSSMPVECPAQPCMA